MRSRYPTPSQAKLWAQKWRWYERSSLPWRRARIHAHFAARGAFVRWPVHGNVLESFDAGRLEVELPPNVHVSKPASVRLFEAAAGTDTRLPTTYGWAFARELEHFADALREDTPFRTEGADSVKDVAIAETAARAAAGLCALPARIEYPQEVAP